MCSESTNNYCRETIGSSERAMTRARLLTGTLAEEWRPDDSRRQESPPRLSAERWTNFIRDTHTCTKGINNGTGLPRCGIETKSIVSEECRRQNVLKSKWWSRFKRTYRYVRVSDNDDSIFFFFFLRVAVEFNRGYTNAHNFIHACNLWLIILWSRGRYTLENLT